MSQIRPPSGPVTTGRVAAAGVAVLLQLTGCSGATDATEGRATSTPAVTAATEASPTGTPPASSPAPSPAPATSPVAIGADSLSPAGSLMPAEPFDAPYGIDLGPDGRIHVFDAGNDQVVVFAEDGRQVATWGGTGSEPGQFSSLGFGGLAVDDEGRVYVVDNGNHRIQVFEPDGAFLAEFGEEGEGPGQFLRPIGIDVAGGLVVVTDDEVPWVQVFTTDGTYLRRLGGPGADPGGLVHATGVVLGEDGTVWVADYEAERVQRFAADGTLEGVWRSPGPAGTAVVPEGLALAPDGSVLVTGYRTGQVLLLPDQPGEETWAVAGGGTGPEQGSLRNPVDLVVGVDGTVHVVDQTTDEVRRFTLDG